MPYHIGHNSRCPASKPWAIIKDSDSSIMGCHPTRAEAEQQMAALYAAEPKSNEDGPDPRVQNG